MTISTTVNRVDVLGNGSATTFSFSPVVITQASDLAVWLLDNLGNQTLLTQGVGPSQYTVVVPTYPGTGSITYPGINGTVLPVGWQLTMKQRAPLLQQFQPQNQGPFLAGTYGNAYDYSILVSQHLDEKLSRAILAAETDIAGALSVPTLISRKNQVWGWDGNGNSIAVQPSSALVSTAMQPVVASTTIAAARTLLGGLVVFTPQLFGAKGDGTTDDTVAVQAAITAALAVKGAVYLQSVSVGYKITSALNCANISQLMIYGDGCYPCTARITPTGGSVLIGATGTGKCVIDASGASALKLRSLTIASIGISNASTIGIFYGNTTIQAGSNCVLEDVSILLPATGASLGIYGVSANLLIARGLLVMADFCIYGSDTDRLSHAPPYGVWGSNIQSDGWHFSGCTCFAYGSVPPFILNAITSHQYDQLYIVNINGGPSYGGQPYAMALNACTDLKIKVEIDYFPCAVETFNDWYNVDLSGIIYQWTTPSGGSVPLIAYLNGTSMFNCRFNIRGLEAVVGAQFLYSSVGTSSATLNAINGTSFWFDTGICAGTGYFNLTAVNAVNFFNCRFDGNTDTVANTYLTNGSGASTSTYRLFVNGVKIGAA